jgi:hypothetical protein
MRDGYLAASHDVVERVFALRLLGRNADADALIARTKKLRYLVDPQDLAVLLARLGPTDAWERLLKPLMEDEVHFVENPPKFDESSLHSEGVATVTARSKSINSGVPHYSGQVRIAAGPWRITAAEATAFHGSRQGTLVSAAGSVDVRGVLGLFGASADELTLNTGSGELKLNGHVTLRGWDSTRQPRACIITRTGEIRETAGD